MLLSHSIMGANDEYAKETMYFDEEVYLILELDLVEALWSIHIFFHAGFIDND